MDRTARYIIHGIRYKSSTNNTEFSLEVIKVSEGIFPAFYEAQIGTTISIARNSTLSIINLLGYCSDMAYQYESAGYGNHKLLFSLSAIGMENMVNHESWSVIGIPAVTDLDVFLNAHRNFLSEYQEVNIPYPQLATFFRMSVPDLTRYRFFQDITPIPMADGVISLQQHIAKLDNALTPYINVHYFENNVDFDLALPYQDANLATPMPVNEALAIYAVMFYLSSLVRYRPNYLESLLNFKPSWLIESFVNSTPETFLRMMGCKIIDKDFVLCRR